MAIQGSLEEVSLPDVLQLLSLGHKTGCLSLTEREMEGEICLEGGLVSHAAVFSRRHRLGDMLVRTGRITQQQLDEAVALQENEGRHVSHTLLESGQVEKGELERFVRTQVEEAVYFMFTWRTGSFMFTSSVQPKRQEFLVAIKPENLLLEGARRVDEWGLIEKRIPSFDVAFRLDPSRLEGAPTLTPEQQQILPLIDGTRDVHGIIEMTGMAEFDIGKALYGLVTAGYARLVERRAAMRHLDYRAMLAYVVREAEFAEPEPRREAARHITDCAICTQRLKTIHVRRTEANAAPGSTTIEQAVGVTPPEAAADSADSAPNGIERRVSERRASGDRRSEDRRVGVDRRQPVEGEHQGPDRRSGRDRRAAGRRITDRRVAPLPGRESAAMVAAQPLTLPQRSRGADLRTTGPRRIPASGLGPAEPVQPKRSTGDRIRLVPPDQRTGPIRLDGPAVKPPARERPARGDSPSKPPDPGETITHRWSAPDTAPAHGDRRAASKSPPQWAESTADKPGKRPKKTRRRDTEVPDLPAEMATAAEPDQRVERARAPSAADRLTETDPRSRDVPLAPPGEPQPAGDTQVDSTEPGKDSARGSSEPQAEAAKPDPQPAPRRGKARSTNLDDVYLVSPDEANHMLRSSRLGLAGPTHGPAQEESAEGAAAALPRTDKTDAGPREAQATALPVESGPEAPRPRTRSATPKGTAREAPARRRERRIGSPPVEVATRTTPERVAVHGAVEPASIRPRRRWLPLTAAAVVLVSVGWLARPILQPGINPEPPPVIQSPASLDVGLPSARAPAEPAAEVAGAETPVVPPTAEPASPPQERVPAATTRIPERADVPPPVSQVTPPVVEQSQPTPAFSTISGAVRDSESGAPLAGVRVTIPGTAFSATTDANGRYTFRDVPEGRITLAAALDGRLPGTREVVLQAGEPAQVDFGLAQPAPAPTAEPAPPPAARVPTPVTAREPDLELESGSWTVTDAATASALLRNTIATIPELWVESIAINETGSRPRARVALLTPGGERIVMTETRSGAPVIGGTPRVTALRIIPGSSAYPVTTGTASFGSLLITAKTTLDADALQSLLTKLAVLE